MFKFPATPVESESAAVNIPLGIVLSSEIPITSTNSEALMLTSPPSPELAVDAPTREPLKTLN